MSTRYEGMDASATTVSTREAGEWVGEDLIREGRIALLFSYDEVVYIEGTRTEILGLLADALTAVMEGVGG